MPVTPREDILSLYAEGGIEAVAAAHAAVVELFSKRLVALESELQHLRDQLSRNSGNSSKPPSSDGFKRVPTTRVRSGKPQGGQHGHKGHHLSLVEHPDSTIIHSVEICPDCRTSLDSAVVLSEERRQIIDIPQPIASVVEHRAQTKQCPCCRRRVKGRFPVHVSHRVTYGGNISSLAVYLCVEHSVSIDRVAEIIEAVSGRRPSAGTICSMIERCAEFVRPSESAIIDAIVASEAAHFDESGIRTEKRIQWIHSASTDRLTHIAVHAKRGSAAMDAIGILPRFEGVAVHDFWKPYLRYDRCLHSFCNAHLLRELQWFSQERKHLWADRLSELLRLLLRLSDDADASDLAIASAVQRYDVLVADALAQHPCNVGKGKRGRVAQTKEHNLLERLRRYKDDVLRFVYDRRAPFTNNQAERDIRPVKTKMKVSGCFRSEQGASIYCRIRSYCSTAKKQRVGAWNALTGAFAETPFMPAT